MPGDATALLASSLPVILTGVVGKGHNLHHQQSLVFRFCSISRFFEGSLPDRQSPGAVQHGHFYRVSPDQHIAVSTSILVVQHSPQVAGVERRVQLAFQPQGPLTLTSQCQPG